MQGSHWRSGGATHKSILPRRLGDKGAGRQGPERRLQELSSLALMRSSCEEPGPSVPLLNLLPSVQSQDKGICPEGSLETGCEVNRLDWGEEGNATSLLIYNNKTNKSHICNSLGPCYNVLVTLSGLAVTFSSGVWARKTVQ